MELKYTKEMDDGRRKLPVSKHAEVRRVYKKLKSQRNTAAFFKVSRRLIVFILYPERLAAFQKARYALRPWLKYHNTAERRETMRKYRAKKRTKNLITTKK